MRHTAHFVLASDANGAIRYENPLALDAPKRVYQWGVVGPWVVAWGSASARHDCASDAIGPGSGRRRTHWPRD